MGVPMVNDKKISKISCQESVLSMGNDANKLTLITPESVDTRLPADPMSRKLATFKLNATSPFTMSSGYPML
jgi:hypothetical protein